MKIAVWGAGNIGTGLVNRLAISSFVDQVIWINRSFDKINRRAVDIKHGLALTTTCTTVIPVAAERAATRLDEADVLLLTHGKGVPPGGTRADAYAENQQSFLQTTIPLLQAFGGIVLVITNPVDLMTRLIVRHTTIGVERVMGLGTVVETARLKSAVAGRLWNDPPARVIDAVAIGTHDEHFIPLVNEAEFPDDLLPSVHKEVVKAAARVKGNDSATLFPIVEGAMSVLTSIAEGDQKRWTVSIVDPNSQEGLCYSLPCRIGRKGWSDRDTAIVASTGCKQQLDQCLNSMRQILSAAPDTPQ